MGRNSFLLKEDALFWNYLYLLSLCSTLHCHSKDNILSPLSEFPLSKINSLFICGSIYGFVSPFCPVEQFVCSFRQHHAILISEVL